MKFAPLALCLLLLPAFAFAQELPSALTSASVPPLTLTLAPQYPQPNSTATLTLDSTILDMADATVTVVVNGTQLYKGTNEPVTIPVGTTGQASTINATAVVDGVSYPVSLSFVPADVSLVEEPVATFPVLYPGKPVVPAEGSVRLVAVADLVESGRRIPANQLEYTWSADGSTLDTSSGIGKDVLLYSAPLEYRGSSVTVTVESQDGAVIGSDSLEVASADPTLRLYEDDPLLGIVFDHALSGTYSVTGTEASIIAVPYSFSSENELPMLTWFLNGSTAQTGSTITLRPTGSGTGTATVSATASDSTTATEATANLDLTFGSTASSGIFGL